MPESWQPKNEAPSTKDQNMMFVPGNRGLKATPEISRMYSIGKESRTEVKTVFEQQREIGQNYGGIFRGQMKNEDYYTGQSNISSTVGAIEAINPASLYSDNSEENLKRIAFRLKMLSEYFSGFYTYPDSKGEKPYLHQDELDLILDSAFAEFAVMQALKERSAATGWEIYHATRDEDVKYGTDSFVWDPNQKKALAIQTKCLTVTKAPEHLAKGLSLDPQSIKDRILDNSDYAGVNLFKNGDYRAKLERRGRALLTNCSKYDNITPVFVFLPKMNGGPVTFDRATGLPKPRMKDELFSELGFML